MTFELRSRDAAALFRGCVRGSKHVRLGVNADNPTGAVRLYERAGMTTNRRSIWYDEPST